MDLKLSLLQPLLMKHKSQMRQNSTNSLLCKDIIHGVVRSVKAGRAAVAESPAAPGDGLSKGWCRGRADTLKTASGTTGGLGRGCSFAS